MTMKPSVLVRLDDLDARLEILLAALEPYQDEQLNRRPAPDRWSPLMIMHHLMISETKSLAYLQKKLSFNPKLKRASVGDRLRSLGLTVFLHLPFKFKAPGVVSGSALPERSTLSETAKQWRKLRRELRSFLSELPETYWNKSIYRHPRAGRMSLEGMLGFFIDHFERHRKQIERML